MARAVVSACLTLPNPIQRMPGAANRSLGNDPPKEIRELMYARAGVCNY